MRYSLDALREGACGRYRDFPVKGHRPNIYRIPRAHPISAKVTPPRVGCQAWDDARADSLWRVIRGRQLTGRAEARQLGVGAEKHRLAPSS
jgi:hypothetical protein